MAKVGGSFEAPGQRETARFYDGLVQGTRSRGWWGAESRFSADKIAASASVGRHFADVVRRYVKPDDRVLDIGCGPGGFLAVLSRLGGEVVGIDISTEFVSACRDTIERLGLRNARALCAPAAELPFPDDSFDVVLLIDVLHHMDAVEPALREVKRVLRPGGRVLVFEPNKLNPLLYLMCVLDRNEWGLLRLGSARRYRALLGPHFEIESVAPSGLLLGPDGPLFMHIAEALTRGLIGKLFGWLSPKLFIVGRSAPARP